MNGRNLLEIFYRELNANTKVVLDTITGKAFMILRWEQASDILDCITKTNRGWHTREADRPAETYSIGVSVKQKMLDDTVAQEVAQLRTEIELLAKKIMAGGTKKINVVGAQSKAPRYEEFRF